MGGSKKTTMYKEPEGKEYKKMVLAKPKYPKYQTVWVSIDGIPTNVMVGKHIPIPGGHIFYYLVGYKGLRDETFVYPTLEEMEKVPRNMREPAKNDFSAGYPV